MLFVQGKFQQACSLHYPQLARGRKGGPHVSAALPRSRHTQLSKSSWSQRYANLQEIYNKHYGGLRITSYSRICLSPRKDGFIIFERIEVQPFEVAEMFEVRKHSSKVPLASFGLMSCLKLWIPVCQRKTSWASKQSTKRNTRFRVGSLSTIQ